jgi:DNA polymerase-1
LHSPPRPIIGCTLDALDALHDIAARGGPVGIDLETAGIDPRTAAITAFGIADEHSAVSVPWHGYFSPMYGPQPGLSDDDTGREIRRCVLFILQNVHIVKVMHNGAFDMNMLRGHGIPIAGPCEDTILAHRVCYPDLRHNLQFCMAHLYPVDPWKSRFDVGRKERKEPKDDWADCEPRALMEYNAGDAAAELPLWAWLQDRLNVTKTGWVQYEHLKQLSAFAAECRWHGVAIDPAEVLAIGKQLAGQLASLHASWSAMTGGVPVGGKGSKAALNKLFFKDLKAPVSQVSRLTGAPSLSSSALLDWDSPTQSNEKLADIAFLKFRISKAVKAKTAFMDPLEGLDRVYPEMDFGGTKGTRASCRNPNLQQWSKPKETRRPRDGREVKLAPALRRVVTADPGFVLVETDANALEARLVAYAANIPVWLEWMEKGIDMHIEHVALMFGQRITKKDDPNNLREITKTLTYARFYNDKASVDMVLRSLKPKMPALTAEFLKEVFARFDQARPEIRDWQLERQNFIADHGYVETGMGGWRQYHDKRFPDVNQAYSFTIQSTAGAFMNQGMLRLNRRLNHDKMRILFQVHDSLMCQARPEYALELVSMIHEEMEYPVDLWNHDNVVIPFETKIGPNWGSMIDAKNWTISESRV